MKPENLLVHHDTLKIAGGGCGGWLEGPRAGAQPALGMG